MRNEGICVAVFDPGSDVQRGNGDRASYTKPFTYTQKLMLLPEEDLLEYFCTENEKDVQHYK